MNQRPMIQQIKLLVMTGLLAFALNAPVMADTPSFNGGHLKYRALLTTFPDDSLFLDYVDTPAVDQSGDLRLKFDWKTNGFQVVGDYQLIAQYGDSIRLANSLPAQLLTQNAAPNDDKRLFDLTHVLSQDNNSVLSHRLDRLYLNITSSKAVVRIGRQAVSWGNGLIYSAMDFFNPFDPASVDNEYKVGDDMMYAQYLRQSGDDLQAVWVVRRGANGKVDNEVDSIAAKYHGFVGDNEYDLLLAEHYSDTIVGIGGIANVGGAVWRGDVTVTNTQTKNMTSLVTSLSYSWMSWGHNVSGIVEYFYNGFGQADGDYSPAALAANPELVEHFIRGELFTLARQYIAASALIEITPLWILTPNVFININDHSFLTQLVSSYDLKQNWQVQAALNIPSGESGTEFGGIDSGLPGKKLSNDLSLYAQLAWYF